MSDIFPPSIHIPQPPIDDNPKSHLLYKWFQHQRGIENVKYKIACLEVELETYKTALKERIELTKVIEEEITGIKELTDG